MMKKAKDMSQRELGSYIDQSVLKPDFTVDEIRKYIQEGIDYNCATVCINPYALDIAAEMTQGTDTKICVVCDFPFGASTTASKVLQAEEYAKRGDVAELDIVANYGLIRSNKWDEVYEDIKAVVDVCHKYGTIVKVIFETDTLNDEQIVKACEVAIKANADFVKTSTGFLTGYELFGAKRETIQLMLDTCKGRIKVKGSGSIRDQKHFFDLIDMGIDRMGIGYRSTPTVLGLNKELDNNNEGY